MCDDFEANCKIEVGKKLLLVSQWRKLDWFWVDAMHQTNMKGINLQYVEAFETVCSGVICISFLNGENMLLGKGTGYMVNGHLVTNSHVFAGSESAATVWLRTFADSTSNFTEGVMLSSEDFERMLVSGSSEANFDFAILAVPQLARQNLYQFELDRTDGALIGQEAAILGYPLDHMNLVFHKAFVSSRYTRNGVDYIQVDASVNAANSGGPLIDLETRKVLGTVTRKGTGLTKVVDQLKEIARKNITFHQSLEGHTFSNNMDPHRVGRLQSEQLIALISEIERSANVGIGYAFSSCHLWDEQSLGN